MKRVKKLVRKIIKLIGNLFMSKKEGEQFKEIELLEKRYFLDIFRVLKNNLDLIEDRLTFFNRNKKYWEGVLKLDNLIAIGVQEIIRSIIYRQFKDWIPFFLPICSDTAFENSNGIINLDVKSVKDIDNDAKQGYLQVRPNQISYPNIPVKGVPWIPHQPVMIKNNEGKNLYTFSFFIEFIWTRKKNDEIDIKEIFFSSIPNGLLAKKYGEEFIVNYKTYDIDKLKELKTIPKDKKIIRKWGSQRRRFVQLEDDTIWSKTKKATKGLGRGWYRINGGTARFNVRKIFNPKLTKGWKRVVWIKD